MIQKDFMAKIECTVFLEKEKLNNLVTMLEHHLERPFTVNEALNYLLSNLDASPLIYTVDRFKINIDKTGKNVYSKLESGVNDGTR